MHSDYGRTINPPSEIMTPTSPYKVGAQYRQESSMAGIIYTCVQLTPLGHGIMAYTLDFPAELMAYSSAHKDWTEYFPPKKGSYWVIVSGSVLDAEAEPMTELHSTYDNYIRRVRCIRNSTNLYIIHDSGRIDWIEQSELED